MCGLTRHDWYNDIDRWICNDCGVTRPNNLTNKGPVIIKMAKKTSKTKKKKGGSPGFGPKFK